LHFGFFYLNEQLGILLVNLAHQLSYYLDSPALSISVQSPNFSAVISTLAGSIKSELFKTAGTALQANAFAVTL